MLASLLVIVNVPMILLLLIGVFMLMIFKCAALFQGMKILRRRFLLCLVQDNLPWNRILRVEV